MQEKNRDRNTITSDFKNSIRDRKIDNIREVTETETADCDVQFEKKSKKSRIVNQAMLCHVRMGLASVKYLKENPKVCYLQSDQGPEFRCDYTKSLEKQEVELQLECPDTQRSNARRES